MDNQNNQTDPKTNLSPIAAGITGFILGVMGTAAVALSDKNTRTKVTKKANEVKDNLEKWSKDTLHDLQVSGEDIKKKAADKTDESRTYSKEVREDVANQADDMLNEEK
jgi:gas vesicle protein